MLKHFENVGIESVCTCVPPHDTNVHELYEYASDLVDEKKAKRFAKGTGFSKLLIADENVITFDLCCKAAEYLLANGTTDKDEIDGLIFVTQTPDWTLPATSHALQYRLGLREDVVCFDVNEGCSGYEAGFFLAANLLAAGSCKKLLLLAGDTISKITDPQDRATRLIFGDAGSASIISRQNCDTYFNLRTYGDRYKAIITENSRHRVSNSDKQGYLFLDGLGIMDFTLNDVPVCVEDLLAFAEMNKEEVELYACHQANKAILDSLADKMGIERAKMPFVATNTGNTSSASIPLLLCQEKPEQREKVVLCGFGVGLACASCLTNLSKTNILGVIDYESGEF